MVHTGSTRTFMWFCMGPVLVLLIIVAIAPVTLAIIDSFRDLSLAVPSKRGQFVALDNYRDLLGSDGKFVTAQVVHGDDSGFGEPLPSRLTRT